MSLRILAGTARGRSIAVPASARPSGVRLRKSLFDLLATRLDEDARVLDLHGGSGAVSLEAASRGYRVTVTEQDAAALRTLTANARALNLRVEVVAGDSNALLPQLARRGPYDMVFSDPPYNQDITALTARLLAAGLLTPQGLLVAQHPLQLRLPEVDGYHLERREYGSNVLSLYQATVAGPA
jgi:16S rRNA (guanine966-N2)-methyltransferase